MSTLLAAVRVSDSVQQALADAYGKGSEQRGRVERDVRVGNERANGTAATATVARPSTEL